jgi:hypothetical protein
MEENFFLDPLPIVYSTLWQRSISTLFHGRAKLTWLCFFLSVFGDFLASAAAGHSWN